MVEFGEMIVESIEEEISEKIQLLCEQFPIVQELPKGLPLRRVHDHAIEIKLGAQPPNIRPYRYPHSQKEEIERLLSEMLTAGLIRSSSSPYSSPVLLARKKDGSWRFCVDY